MKVVVRSLWVTSLLNSFLEVEVRLKLDVKVGHQMKIGTNNPMQSTTKHHAEAPACKDVNRQHEASTRHDKSGRRPCPCLSMCVGNRNGNNLDVSSKTRRKPSPIEVASLAPNAGHLPLPIPMRDFPPSRDAKQPNAPLYSLNMAIAITSYVNR